MDIIGVVSLVSILFEPLICFLPRLIERTYPCSESAAKSREKQRDGIARNMQDRERSREVVAKKNNARPNSGSNGKFHATWKCGVSTGRDVQLQGGPLKTFLEQGIHYTAYMHR